MSSPDRLTAEQIERLKALVSSNWSSEEIQFLQHALPALLTAVKERHELDKLHDDAGRQIHEANIEIDRLQARVDRLEVLLADGHPRGYEEE
jgi:hypothetical protein